MSFVVKHGRDEHGAGIAPALEPARAGRESAAELAELVSQPVRRGRRLGVDSRPCVRAVVAAAFESARSRAAGGAASIQGEVARRRRARAAAPAHPPAAPAPEKIAE